LLRDVVSLLWSRGIQQVHLVGHGLGGMLGYLWLQEDPGSLLSLTTFGAPAHYPKDRWQVTLSQRINRIREKIANQKRLADRAARQHSDNDETIAFLREEIFIKTDWLVWDLIREQLPPLDFRDLLREVRLPMLWLEPESDYLLKSASFRKALRETRDLIQQQPQGEVMALPGCGHVAQLDHPQQFNESVVSFLTRIQV
jgi:pimeloyl-ACP methyl ester carboxylesterase